MSHFIHRPIPRLVRYELLLRGILETAPPGHEDKTAIPSVIEILKSLGKDTEPGVASAEQKVDLWKYNSSIVFKPGEHFVSPSYLLRLISIPFPKLMAS
jgi:hypothetical protein